MDSDSCALLFFLGAAVGAAACGIGRPFLDQRLAYEEQIRIGLFGFFGIALAGGAVFILCPVPLAKELSLWFFGAGGAFFALMRFLADWRKPP